MLVPVHNHTRRRITEGRNIRVCLFVYDPLYKQEKITSEAWVSNQWPATMYCTARSHVCKLCINGKGHTINSADRRTTYHISRAALEPAHKNLVVTL